MLTYETVSVPVLPDNLKEYFGEYKACFFDSHCGEPVAWGFCVRKHLGDTLWGQASQLGEMECNHGYPVSTWYLITKRITPEEAVQKYGEVTDYELGVKGGFQSVTFKEKKFWSKDVYDYEHKDAWFKKNKERYQKKK